MEMGLPFFIAINLCACREDEMPLAKQTLTKPIKLLAVDDNPTALRLLEAILTRARYEVATAVNGREALQYLSSNPDEIESILLDRMMPGMDGIEVCAALKADPRLRDIPVIMQTAADRPEEISEGIQAGVFYYLTKPLDKKTLLSVVSAAVKQAGQYRKLRKEIRQQQKNLGLVQVLQCTFKTLTEADTLAPFLASLFPEPDRVVAGISELLINAVEHGNLGISYDLKSMLVAENRWQEEINRRYDDPCSVLKKVRVAFFRRDKACTLEITDEGEGFDWRRYLEVEPLRATHNHGRGIAMANMLSFDEMHYNELGNQVLGTMWLSRRKENGQ
jgi:two-component system, cell cycle response regulator